jgi:hypothetical protein
MFFPFLSPRKQHGTVLSLPSEDQAATCFTKFSYYYLFFVRQNDVISFVSESSFLNFLILKITFSFLCLLCVCCIKRGRIRVIVRISVAKILVTKPGFSTSLISKPIISQNLTQIQLSFHFYILDIFLYISI